MKKNPLGKYAIKRFLRENWQTRPLVLRAVAPHLAQALDRNDLIDLACRDDVESRLIVGGGRSWQVRHGPFRRRDFAGLPARNWTLLVNGIENLVPAARALQVDFGFVPYARHDDVMVSYAAPGGGVGPHFDSYDVFLLQGAGTRRWQISNQRDLTLIEGAPLKILRRFRPQAEYLMESGDLLYLPPSYAHNGTAVGECLTWSIGTRALHQHEVAARFLDYLQDHLTAADSHSDRAMPLQTHRAQISPALQRAARRMVRAVRWRDADIDRCLGEMLSEPRQSVVFEPPPAISAAAFARAFRVRGLQLDLKSRLLFDRGRFYLNGDAAIVEPGSARALQALADNRMLAPDAKPGQSALALLYAWYCAGYLQWGAMAAREPKSSLRRHAQR